MTSMTIESTTLEQRAAVFAALSDPLRLRILDELGRSKKCVCTIQETIEIAPNLMSYHLRVLREAGLVEASRRGRWVDYQLTATATALVDDALPDDLVPGGKS